MQVEDGRDNAAEARSPQPLSWDFFFCYLLLNMIRGEDKRPLVHSTGGETVSIVAVAFAPAKSFP